LLPQFSGLKRVLSNFTIFFADFTLITPLDMRGLLKFISRLRCTTGGQGLKIKVQNM
jgi:hypothetical protein